MIEKTINEIKKVEQESEERLVKAKKEAVDKVKDCKFECEKEWDEIHHQSNLIKTEIITKYENEAHEELNNIQEQADKDKDVLHSLFSKKNIITDSIVKKLLKEP